MNSTLLSRRWERLPERQVRRLQLEKFRNYLRSVVLPFSAHYRKMFEARGLGPEHFRSLEDLEQIPFTSKVDLVNSPEHPQRSRDFILIPDQKVLARRPSTMVRALVTGRQAVKRGFESEFRPVFMT